MTYLVYRLAELRRHLAHARSLAPRVPDHTALERDLSLHNDVLYTLLMMAQLVIDIGGDRRSPNNGRVRRRIGRSNSGPARTPRPEATV